MVAEENLYTLMLLSPDEDTVLSNTTKSSHEYQCAENFFLLFCGIFVTVSTLWDFNCVDSFCSKYMEKAATVFCAAQGKCFRKVNMVVPIVSSS